MDKKPESKEMNVIVWNLEIEEYQFKIPTNGELIPSWFGTCERINDMRYY